MGTLEDPWLRCNERKIFSAVESMPAQNSVMGRFQLSFRRCRMALDFVVFFVLAVTARAVA